MGVERRRVSCGALIREARRRHSLGQRELAGRLGVSQPVISRLEQDRVSPTVETLERILNAVGETLWISPRSLAQPVPKGSNQSIAELRADYALTAEKRLEQAVRLSEAATELAAQAER